jgi:hypothetical protein
MTRTLVLAAVVLAVNPALLLATPETGTCANERYREQQLNEYVAQNGSYPVELSDFQGLSSSLQKSAFARLSAQEKAGLWLQNLDNFEKLHELNPKQIKLLDLLRELLRPELFYQPLDPGLKVARDELQLASSVLFSPEQVRSIALRLGETAEGSRDVLPLWDITEAKQTTAFDKEDAPDCKCNTRVTDECESITICKSHERSYTYCEPTSFGCGFFWLDYCDGECCFYVFGEWWC